MKKVLICLLFIVGMCPITYAAPITWSDNNHTYDFKAGSFTWQEAKAQAELDGGYLATVTSASENAFLLSHFFSNTGSNFAWLGGYQYDNAAEPAGHWRWVTNDEPWAYTNWGGIEPNSRQANEDYAMFNIGTSFAGIAPGQWGDAVFVPSGYDPVNGYLIEHNPVVTPEPVSSTLFLLGGGAMAFLRRKQLFNKV